MLKSRIYTYKIYVCVRARPQSIECRMFSVEKSNSMSNIYVNNVCILLLRSFCLGNDSVFFCCSVALYKTLASPFKTFRSNKIGLKEYFFKIKKTTTSTDNNSIQPTHAGLFFIIWTCNARNWPLSMSSRIVFCHIKSSDW